MSFELNPLPYPETALEPAIGRETVSIHYHKHHGGYVKKLNDALTGRPRKETARLEAVIETARTRKDQAVYNLAAQVWNHDFYWQSLSPERGAPTPGMRKQIEARFSSLAEFETAFKTAALNEFGSGWTWLCWNHAGSELEILSTTDAVIPDPRTHTPVLTLDVWEHAYYLDYRNDRAAYIEQFLENLINWENAEKRLEHALASTAAPAVRRAT